MKFCWTTISVKNMEESIKFYKEIVGLEIDKRYAAGPGREIAFMGAGETKVELIFDAYCTEVSFGKDISLGFEVASVDDMLKFLEEKRIAIQSGPFQPNPRVKFFFIQDPNGLKIQFVENM